MREVREQTFHSGSVRTRQKNAGPFLSTLEACVEPALHNIALHNMANAAMAAVASIRIYEFSKQPANC